MSDPHQALRAHSDPVLPREPGDDKWSRKMVLPPTEAGRQGAGDSATISDGGSWSGIAIGAELRQAKILIVDDEPANLRLLTRALNRAGFSELQCIADPFEAMATFERFRPDLVLLDLHMPGLDGISLLEELRRKLPSEAYLPILILTGDARSEPRRAALAQGATDFVVKPFDLPEVVLRIRNMLETRALHLMLQQQNERLEVKVQVRTPRSGRVATRGA